VKVQLLPPHNFPRKHSEGPLPYTPRRPAKEVHAAVFVAKGDLGQNLLPTLDRLLANHALAQSDSSASRETSAAHGVWLAGGGELGKLIREKDWSQTPLGPIPGWPHNQTHRLFPAASPRVYSR
jgi:hypothetical protein